MRFCYGINFMCLCWEGLCVLVFYVDGMMDSMVLMWG